MIFWISLHLMKQLIIANKTYPSKDGFLEIDVTSRSITWSRGLSPFFLGPVQLYDGYISQNVENAWQYSKVYCQHTDCDNNPAKSYFEWAQKGWNKRMADRYPMGRGAIPLYSLWKGEKLDYISARKQIYLPLYSSAVSKTAAYTRLKNIFDETDNLMLRDFDAHNIDVINYDIYKLLNNSSIKFGHGYVLAMMLLDYKI